MPISVGDTVKSGRITGVVVEIKNDYACVKVLKNGFKNFVYVKILKLKKVNIL